MAHTGATEAGSMEDDSARQESGLCLRARWCSSERDVQVRAVRAALLSKLGPYEPVLTYLQSVLVWERPLHSVLLYIVVNVVFWWVFIYFVIVCDLQNINDSGAFTQSKCFT